MSSAPFNFTKGRRIGLAVSLVAAFVMQATLASSQTFPALRSAGARRPPANERGGVERPRPSEAYGKLPLRFEANRGQTSDEVKFLARGARYALFLTQAGAVLRLRGSESPKEDETGASSARAAGTLRFRLEGANRSPKVVGLGELPGKSNYLFGDARRRLTDVPAFERVRYESVYPGVDMVYYGNEGRLEYDFILAPGASPGRIRLRFDGARRTRIEDNGDLVINTDGGDVRQQRPLAYQGEGDARREVAARYVKDSRGAVRFEVGDYDRSRPLVIDPVLVYSSYLGGGGTDEGFAVAVDSAGSAYVAGWTTSVDFPGPSALQGAKNLSAECFVVKMSPDGKSLVYATYLGGDGNDFASAIAVDSAGNAYVAGQTSSANFPHTAGALQESKDALIDGFVAKLNPTGSALVYSTYLGGGGGDQIFSVALDAAGAAYVAGRTDSVNFTRAPSAKRAGTPLLMSTDGGANWAGSGNGLNAAAVNSIAAAAADPNVVYAGTNAGVYKSTDGGANWQLTGQARASTAPALTRAVVLDPSNPNVVYAGGVNGVYRSTDGGALYEVKNSGFSGLSVNTLAIDPASPSTLYAGNSFGIYKTTNGGDTWAEASGGINGASPSVNKIIIDPGNTQVVYASTDCGVYKTTNGGVNWANLMIVPGFTPIARFLALDPSNTSTLYVMLGSGLGVYKTTNGGASWASSGNGLTVTEGGVTFLPSVVALLVDPASPATVYAATAFYGVFKSIDSGANWAASNTGLTNRNLLTLAWRGGNPAAVLAGANVAGDAFAAKFNPAGSQLEYLRRLGGIEADEARGIAVGADNSAYVAGTTISDDFPVTNAFQPARGGFADAFVTKLEPSGATAYSTYLGGSSGEFAEDIAVGPGGTAYVTGSTFSNDFPTASPIQAAREDSVSGDAFVTKLAADGQTLAYSTYLGGRSYDEGFGIAVGADGAAYVTGITESTNFPTVNTAYGGGGFEDAFLTKINPAGSALTFSTTFGGRIYDQGYRVAIDAAGGIYVAGATNSENLSVANAARASYGGGVTDGFVAKFAPGVELAVTMTDAPDPVALGGDLTYTVGVKNNGDVQATGVRLTDALPEGASLVSAATAHGACTGTSTVVCDLGTLAGGEAASVTITIRPPAVKTISNTATVTLNENDAVPANNSASATTTVDYADLTLTQKSSHDLVAPGTRVSYIVRVKNKGVAAAPSVKISDALPAGTTFASCAATAGGVCANTGNNVTVTFPSLAAGATGAALLSATLDTSAAEGTVISNTASVSSSIGDPAPGDNSATAAVTVAARTILPKSNGLIVFGSDRAFTSSAQPTGLYTVNPDGTGEKFLPGTPAFFSTPSWSPDGSKLAFAAGKELKVANPDGTGAVTVANNVSSFNRRISWSPNGAQLAYIGEGSGDRPETLRAINVASADGSGFSMLPNSPGLLDSADWSPDGTKFLYANGAIHVMGVDGGARKQLTFPPSGSDGQTFDRVPRWSPDGTMVLFERASNNFNDVYLMNADGTGPTRLLNVFRTKTPAWSPDGSKLVFESLNELYAINLDGSGQVALTQNRFYDFAPDWQPLPGASPTPTPTPFQSFSITGLLLPAPGERSQPSGTVKLTGTRTATAEIGPGGQFTFVRLPAGGDYTVSVSSDYYSFTPAGREYKNLGADVTNANFFGTFVPANITGRVTDNNGNPLAGITVRSLGGSPTGETTTNADGAYSFPNVQRGQTYFVNVDPYTAYTFDPPQRVFQSLKESVTADFVGTKQPSNVIRGRVVEAATGLGLGGLRVNLARDFNAAASTFTDANGNFTFGERQSNHQYSVYVDFNTTHVFAPAPDAQANYARISIPNLRSEQNLLFTGARRNTVQFSASRSAAEGDGHVDLLVTRTGDTSAPARVNYSTADGTAAQASDYTTAIGTLRFAPNETTKAVRVLLTDDSYVEGVESFTLNLEGTVGAQLGGFRVAAVQIQDNDTSPPASNPADSTQFFVRQHYADFLNREPDADGLAFWTNEVESCGADAACREVKRINVSAAFFLSIEFQETGYLVYRLHKAAFNAGEALYYKNFLRDTQEVGRGVVVGQGDWRTQLELNKQAFVNAFVLRPEFASAYPDTLSPTQFVDALDANTGGSLSPVERDLLINALSNGLTTRAGVLRAVAENAEFTRREFNRAFVLMQYFGYLRRNPDDPPDADFRGWRFWLDKLNQFGGNFIEAEMVKAFISSNEYRQRFGR